MERLAIGLPTIRDTRPREADSTEPPQRTGPGTCDVCGGPTYEAHCKVICRRCGYTRDCSDP